MLNLEFTQQDHPLRVIRSLGKGAMAEVYLVTSRMGEEGLLALKTLKSGLTADSFAVRRFDNEIRAGKLIQHDNVIRIHSAVMDQGFRAFIMEFADGGSLEDLLAEEKPLSLKNRVGILMQMASGLSAIHSSGIVHRDLKPANILFRGGRAKIADFGAAYFIGESDLTRSGMLIGTPRYVAPEYLASGHCDCRSDIYAFGLIAFELLCGRHPFETNSRDELIELHMRGQIPPLREVFPACPAALAGIVDKCLHSEPQKRFQTADELFWSLSLLESEGYSGRLRSDLDCGVFDRMAAPPSLLVHDTSENTRSGCRNYISEKLSRLNVKIRRFFRPAQ